MARKRIKTFAQEWGISVDDVLATCARLKLGHAHSDSSLLTPEEADRVKHDLDEQVHRQELLRRETVVETSAGKVVEKRLNATVMRRRHTEPEAGFAQAAAEPDVPFHFELEGEREDAFATPFLEERIEPAEPATPAMLETQAAASALQETPAPHAPPSSEHPADAPSGHAAPNGAAATAEHPAAEPNARRRKRKRRYDRGRSREDQKPSGPNPQRLKRPGPSARPRRSTNRSLLRGPSSSRRVRSRRARGP